MKFEIDKKTMADAKMVGAQAMKAVVFTSLLLVAGGAFAGGDELGGTDTRVCGFLNNVTRLLNMGSIAVVTIAVIVAGYQIAFAHKRISEVSPILIGGVLIGAAGQIANMILQNKEGGDGNTCDGVGLLMQIAQYYA
ncbi:TrbC/VirB2 family protein [Xanthomonas nasturtii]|uniref:TrbC/VirB2 family protein n=1 Tax=Xanthomonas nasturtii TaxID=1843581 RepID=UPI002013785F|nr:TrbC/VirB2 family protein [Xanthomonas nasturtii]MCL1501264.1 TrbC/VirB2 family protein [Xanthomonas nasturtii]MCL1505071.1 TrbC/VirB2 family protein [Xanthomonas nasturtii]MCL1524722.1 TrbC/VirB2 family protein [Xanthomonas nasturtii]